jgi:hypothetical protein
MTRERDARAARHRRVRRVVSRTFGSFARASTAVAASRERRQGQAHFQRELRTPPGRGTAPERPSESGPQLPSCLARLNTERELLRGASGLRRHVRRTGRPNLGDAPHTTAPRHGFLRALQDEVRPARRRASSLRSSARAVVHGTGETRPSRTSAERRRSSSAQTATTSSSVSSRLDNNSTAMRARSSRDNRSASASRSSVDTFVSLALGFSGSGNGLLGVIEVTDLCRCLPRNASIDGLRKCDVIPVGVHNHQCFHLLAIAISIDIPFLGLKTPTNSRPTRISRPHPAKPAP